MGSIARALPRLGGRDRGAARGGGLRRARNGLAIASLVAVALAAGYLLWLRHSPLVAIESVNVRGADERPDLVAALEAEARSQTTLALDRGALAATVAADPAVRGIAATPDFPRAVSIVVDLREPIGYLPSSGAIVAGDGVVLSAGGGRSSELATIEAKGGGSPGSRVDGDALTLARVLGAAPGPLLAEVAAAEIDADLGPLVVVEPGIELRFGDRSRAGDKWRAAAAVLADRRLKETAYLDLSVPGRPVAGAAPAAAD
jgi:cell division septal protein FtsQ